VSAAAAATHLAGDMVAGALAARFPHMTPGQGELLETAIVRGPVVAASGGCALAVIRPQPDGALHISAVIIASDSLRRRTRIDQ
jgi:hypothetical protein